MIYYQLLINIKIKFISTIRFNFDFLIVGIISQRLIQSNLFNIKGSIMHLNAFILNRNYLKLIHVE